MARVLSIAFLIMAFKALVTARTGRSQRGVLNSQMTDSQNEIVVNPTGENTDSDSEENVQVLFTQSEDGTPVFNQENIESNGIEIRLEDLQEITDPSNEIAFITITLDISNSSLSSLPENTRYLINLRTLDASNNQITEFPEELCNVFGHLKILNLRSNNLKRLPKTIENLKNLQILILSNNPLEQDDEGDQLGIEGIRRVLPATARILLVD